MMFRAGLFALALGLFAHGAAAEGVRVVSETGDDDLIDRIEDEIAVDDAPDTRFEARRVARRAAERAEAYLNSIGYFSPDIAHAVAPGEPWTALVSVEPGPAYALGDLAIDFGKTDLPDADRRALEAAARLKPGDRAIPKDVVAQEAAYLAILKSLGYADARALDQRVFGDAETATVDVIFRLRPGPKVRLGAVRFADEVRTRRPYLDRVIPFEPGDVYTPQALSSLSRRLNATRLYEIASARLDEDSARPHPDGGEVRDVIVLLKERPRYTLSAGGSFSTAEGPGVTTSLTRRNATRRGDTLTGAVTVAEQLRAVSADWRIPHALGYNKALAFTVEVAREETDAFDRDALTVTGAYEIRRERGLTLAFGGASEFTSEDDAFEERDLQVLSLSAGARLDRSDDPLDPVRGWRADARVEPALALGDDTSQFVSLIGQASAYTPLFNQENFVLAGRARSGRIYGAGVDDLPVSRRFFAGGGGSARGFEYQSVGPRGPDGDPTGGRGLLEVSAELRWRREGRLGYVAFLDGANVSNGQWPGLSDLRYSAGLGLRYRTPVGPIRFDIAAPLNRNDGDESFQIYVSLGQAF